VTKRAAAGTQRGTGKGPFSGIRAGGGWHGTSITGRLESGGGKRHVKLSRIIFSLFFFSPWFMQSAFGERPASLVEIFCEQTSDGGTEWVSLVGRLESKTAIDESVEQNPEFKACVSENSSYFSVGEFVWAGRRMLQDAVRHTMTASKAGVQVALAATDFELPLVGTISVGTGQGTLSEAVDPYGYAERSKQYEQLWEEFLKGLKDRMESRTGDRQVARNTP